VKFNTWGITAGLILLGAPLWPQTDGGAGTFRAKLAGSKEVPVNLSAGTGDISVKIDESPASATIVLEYSGMTGNASMAHLHLGNPWESGPVIVTICGGGSSRTCPAQNLETRFTFPLTAGAITAVPGQGFTADVATLIRAIRAGAVYANVHTAQYPNGEIRGQIGRGSRKGQGAGGPGNRNNDDNPGKGKDKGN
jgi:hypothetical protein